MIDRYIRSYEIQILTPKGEAVNIRPPFSVNFQITRNVMASANKCSLTIFNLGANTRAKLYKDRFNLTDYWQITIKASYLGRNTAMGLSGGVSLPTVFQGSIYECSSQKKQINWETTFDCFDGGFGIQNGFTSTTLAKGHDFGTMIKTVIADMPNTIAGVIGNKSQNPDTSMRGKSLMGPSYDVLSQETNGKNFIDNEKLNVLADNEVLPGAVIVLDASLLRTTPKRREAFLDCELNFFPEAQVGRYCDLKSQETMYNGQYEIKGFTHNVSIQGDNCGDASTTINLYKGALALEVAL
jgi:hypothetical protein